MGNTVIKVEGLGKQYRLGQVGSATFGADLKKFARRLQGKKEQPLDLGEENDRTKKGNSDIVWALKDINFSVTQGDVLGIIGRNGAGKSTLLKILSRTTSPTFGTYKVKGRIASLLEVGTGFHPDLTGRENVFLNGAILGMTKKEIALKFDEIVAFSGVERYIDTPVKRYSSGMYVRLAFAVAAHLEPEILIVDEVLAVGDAEFQKKCMGKMKAVSGEGRTVLFVSHQLGTIKSLCTKGLLLHNGTIQYSGSANEAVNYYLRSFTSMGSAPTNVTFTPKDNKRAQILDVKIYDVNQEQKLNFDVFEKIFIEIYYVLNEDISGLGVGLNIDRGGEILACSSDTDENPERLALRKKGVYKTIVQLPHPLKSGTYTISSIGIGITNVGGIDSHDNIFNFFVEENSFDPTFKSYSANRPGIMFASLKWETSFLEEV
ncbi:MAG: ABC transporter ATP-binding protein [Bacteroidetes bacterium]|nr:ABC transporter ATP-binding protein [Bacteroidota bacterium]